MKPLDLASILATGSKGRHQTWKLCISLASLTKSSNPLDKVLCQWTQSKVSLKNPFSSVKVKGCKSEMIGHFKQSKSSETYHAMVQKLTVDSRQSVIQVGSCCRFKNVLFLVSIV